MIALVVELAAICSGRESLDFDLASMSALNSLTRRAEEVYKTVHLVKCTKNIGPFRFVPRKSLGSRQASLFSKMVGKGDGPCTYVQCSPQRVPFFLGADSWAVLSAGVDRNGNVTD